jgi:hypothetical protein
LEFEVLLAASALACFIGVLIELLLPLSGGVAWLDGSGAGQSEASKNSTLSENTVDNVLVYD